MCFKKLLSFTVSSPGLPHSKLCKHSVSVHCLEEKSEAFTHVFVGLFVWGAVRKIIISDRFSTKTAISAHIQLYLCIFSYLCAEITISVHIQLSLRRDSYLRDS